MTASFVLGLLQASCWQCHCWTSPSKSSSQTASSSSCRCTATSCQCSAWTSHQTAPSWSAVVQTRTSRSGAWTLGTATGACLHMLTQSCKLPLCTIRITSLQLVSLSWLYVLLAQHAPDSAVLAVTLKKYCCNWYSYTVMPRACRVKFQDGHRALRVGVRHLGWL